MPMVSYNVAEEYAQIFSLPGRKPTEEAWQFRVRIAQTLEQSGETVRAHEALWNERMDNDPSIVGPLNRGYDETFIATTAQHVEALYQEIQKRQQKQIKLES